MRHLGDVLAGVRAKAARRARPMPPPSLRSETRGKSVYEVIAAARRACDAMQLEMGPEPQSRMLPAWERAQAPDDDAAAPYLEMVRRFGAKLARRAKSAQAKRTGLEFVPGDHVSRSPYAQGDDHKPADPQWLQLVLLAHLQSLGHAIRPPLLGGKFASRGAWRRAMAQVCRKPPLAYAKLSGAVVTALSRATRAKIDVRCEPNYCADLGWGSAVTGFANVSSRIHKSGGCPFCRR